jgi:hypothetical protein
MESVGIVFSRIYVDLGFYNWRNSNPRPIYRNKE